MIITLLMHGSHVAQHASADWLASLRNGVPRYETRDGVSVESDRSYLSFQCLGCNRILGSADVDDGEEYEE